MANPLTTIRDSLIAEFGSIDGVGPAAACVPWEILDLKVGKVPGTFELQQAATPPDYPGSLIAVDDEDLTIVQTRQSLGESSTIFEAKVTIAHYATSDGSVQLLAQQKAWDGAFAIHQHVVLFTPTGANGVLRPGDAGSIRCDNNTHGVLMDFYVQFEIQVRRL